MPKLKHVVPFENSDFLSLERVDGMLLIQLARRMRVKPLPGMKQPTPDGAVMGLELVLTVADGGQPAQGYGWLVRYGSKPSARILYRGRTGADGTSLIPLGLPYGASQRLTLEVWRPGRVGPSFAAGKPRKAVRAAGARGKKSVQAVARKAKKRVSAAGS